MNPFLHNRPILSSCTNLITTKASFCTSDNLLNVCQYFLTFRHWTNVKFQRPPLYGHYTVNLCKLVPLLKTIRFRFTVLAATNTSYYGDAKAFLTGVTYTVPYHKQRHKQKSNVSNEKNYKKFKHTRQTELVYCGTAGVGSLTSTDSLHC